ncbi:MAG TPA: hypothetical protein VFE14_00525 [Micromonosporaceae bacterium]|jgi:hypothetical protein|nr:hypothetical protein [Micromonosporaceae bacterium]
MADARTCLFTMGPTRWVTPPPPPLWIRRPRPRHRLGSPGLRHSRELCPTAERRRAVRAAVAPRHAAPAPSRVRQIRSAAVLVALGTLLISGWFVAAGASAFAQMIGP